MFESKMFALNFEGSLWKWFVCIATIIGFIAGYLTLCDYIFPGKRPVAIEMRDGSLTIEQTVDPETLKKHRESDGTIKLEKGITISPEETE